MLSSETRIRSAKFCSEIKTYSSRFRTDQNKGLWAENQVVAHMTGLQWQLRGRRVKLKNGEVDLIFKKQKFYLFIEVKYLNDQWNVFERISVQQKRKLIQNRVYYSLRFKEFIFSAAIALVESGMSKNKPSTLNLIHLEE